MSKGYYEGGKTYHRARNGDHAKESAKFFVDLCLLPAWLSLSLLEDPKKNQYVRVISPLKMNAPVPMDPEEKILAFGSAYLKGD